MNIDCCRGFIHWDGIVGWIVEWYFLDIEVVMAS